MVLIGISLFIFPFSYNFSLFIFLYICRVPPRGLSCQRGHFRHENPLVFRRSKVLESKSFLVAQCKLYDRHCFGSALKCS